jgi:hypothetical protein
MPLRQRLFVDGRWRFCSRVFVGGGVFLFAIGGARVDIARGELVHEVTHWRG